jgi:outer membrane protein TolC
MIATRINPAVLVGLGVLCGASPAVGSQNPAALTSRGAALELQELQDAAVEADPRFEELRLREAQTALRLDNIDAERLPAVTAEAQTQYQSDVPSPPIGPGALPLFAPPKGTYTASLRIDQRIFDPTLGPRAAVERAQLAESQARVRARLFGLRQEVTEAFFTAALVQERLGAVAAAIADLEGRLGEAGARVREGAAVPADAAAVEAVLLERRQEEDELRAARTVALRRLSDLTGRSIGADDVLRIPELAPAVASALRARTDVRTRPEYDEFARARARIERQGEAAIARERPRISAFARVGFGRPGLNFLSDELDTYGLAGLQVQWNAWTWGTAARERDALAIERQIVAASEAAFTDSLWRSVEDDLAAIDRLERALALDDRIVTLRETIERAAGLRFMENVTTASEYLDRSTELLQARSARAARRVQLAQARARFLTSLGLEVR